MARPTKLDEELIKKICNLIMAGAYIETAAASCEISKEAFYQWLRKGNKRPGTIYAALVDSVHKAVADSEMRDLAVIDKSANGQKAKVVMVNGQPLIGPNGKPVMEQIALAPDWKAAAWRLERKFPRRWGNKIIQVDDDQGGPMKLKDCSDEDLDQKIEEMERKMRGGKR